ncbi:MAG: class I SAM-dependent methyltransferase [Ilumatobacteraceae bacterium]
MTEIAALYDDWADDYDAAHADWRLWVREHGALLADALADRGLLPPSSVLDCTCGIGTQAIGLALAGYSVTGTDISVGEIERATVESAGFGVDASFAVADLLDRSRLDPAVIAASRTFDAVLSANSLTHFAELETIELAIAVMAASTRRGGVVAITNRDYDAVEASRPTSTPPQRSVRDGVARVSFQLWEWDDDGRSYAMEDVLLKRAPGAAEWTVRSRTTRLRAWRRADIEAAAAAAGLTDFRWTHRGVQPIFTAIKP